MFRERLALRRAPVRRRRRGRSSTDGRDRGSSSAAARPDGADRAGPAPGWSTSRAACSRPASSTPTCTRSRAGWSGCAATCPRRDDPRGLPRRDRGVRRRRTRTTPWILGGGWAMPAFPGGTPTAADLDRGGAGPAGVPAQPRPPRRLGQQPGAGDRRDRRATPPTRPTAGSSATPTAARRGTLHEGATRAGRRATLPRTTGEDYYAALLAGQAYLHSLGVTGWQDAIVGAYSGMDDPALDLRDGRRQRRPALARRRRAVVGARGSASSRSPTWSGGGTAMTGGRFRATSVKIMQDGVAENGTAAMTRAVPRPLRPPDRQRGPLVRRRRARSATRSPRSTPPASRCTCTRSATAAAREALDAFEGTDPGPPAPHRPPPAGPPRRRAALRRARRRREHADALGLPATTRWST